MLRKKQRTEMSPDCRFCGRKHKFVKELCPAWGKTCSNCQKLNHFAAKCRGEPKQQPRGVNSLMYPSEASNVFGVLQVSAIHLRPEQTITLQLSSKNAIRFQIDNGADCNVLPLHVYRSATGDHELQKVKPSTTTLWAFGQKRVHTLSEVRICRRKISRLTLRNFSFNKAH